MGKARSLILSPPSRIVETGHTWRTTERQAGGHRYMGLAGRQREGNMMDREDREEGPGWWMRFWLQERPGGEGVSCVGWGWSPPARFTEGAEVVELVGVRTPAPETQILDPAPAQKPKPLSPPPSQFSCAKKPTTFMTSGG